MWSGPGVLEGSGVLGQGRDGSSPEDTHIHTFTRTCTHTHQDAQMDTHTHERAQEETRRVCDVCEMCFCCVVFKLILEYLEGSVQKLLKNNTHIIKRSKITFKRLKEKKMKR